MFHAVPVIFQRPSSDVGNEEITNGMTIWQQLRLRALPCGIAMFAGHLVTEPGQNVVELSTTPPLLLVGSRLQKSHQDFDEETRAR